MASALSEVQHHQEIPYSFQPVPTILNWIQSQPVWTEDQISLFLQPASAGKFDILLSFRSPKPPAWESSRAKPHAISGLLESPASASDEKSSSIPYICKEWIEAPYLRTIPLRLASITSNLINSTDLLNVFDGFALQNYSFTQGLPEDVSRPDHFGAEVYQGGLSILCLASNCKQCSGSPAAFQAGSAYLSYLRDNQSSIFEVRDAARLITRAFQKAHISITDGTTTFCGGLTLKLELDSSK